MDGSIACATGRPAISLLESGVYIIASSTCSHCKFREIGLIYVDRMAS